MKRIKIVPETHFTNLTCGCQAAYVPSLSWVKCPNHGQVKVK